MRRRAIRPAFARRRDQRRGRRRAKHAGASISRSTSSTCVSSVAAAGDLGMSFKYSDPVIGLIGERLPATIELAIASMLIAIVVRHSARRLGRRQAEFLGRQSRFGVRLFRHFDAELLARHHADPDRVGIFQLAAVLRPQHLWRRRPGAIGLLHHPEPAHRQHESRMGRHQIHHHAGHRARGPA